MTRSGSFPVDVHRDFPHLAHPPLVEATIHWQASPSKSSDHEEWKKELAHRLGDYSLRMQRHSESSSSSNGGGVHVRHWDTFQLISADEKHVCRITPNAVAFSRLAPYENWPTLVAEALRCWDSFVELAAPLAVDRLGVRFINQIALKSEEKPSDLVNETAQHLETIGLQPDTFFREDLFDTPGHPYQVNLVRGMQGSQPPLVPQRLLIVDIDVFTAGPMSTEKSAIEIRLKELRFLKNLVFFNFIKEPVKRFGGTP
jgi:uncharacterized protein (TIGR04255 family)